MSAEFVVGPHLANNLVNLGLSEAARQAAEELELDITEILDQEEEPGLGNGGLGRLAACFLESMATIGVPAHGYGIRYEHGLFRQRFESGQQVESPEDWLVQKHPWEFERPEASYEVGFKGYLDGEAWVPRR